MRRRLHQVCVVEDERKRTVDDVSISGQQQDRNRNSMAAYSGISPEETSLLTGRSCGMETA